MEKRYKLVFVYPDGHIEEIDDAFKSGRDALEYGDNLLGQVHNTEKFRDHSSVDVEDFFGKKPMDPYYMIVEINNKKYRMVYDSRSGR
ncbi:MAG: hypothetical protein IJU64_05335 [Bacilli bacterium]|nr:hypothetical protein [Bacilli bacterium]